MDKAVRVDLVAPILSSIIYGTYTILRAECKPAKSHKKVQFMVVVCGSCDLLLSYSYLAPEPLIFFSTELPLELDRSVCRRKRK